MEGASSGREGCYGSRVTFDKSEDKPFAADEKSEQVKEIGADSKLQSNAGIGVVVAAAADVVIGVDVGVGIEILLVPLFFFA